LSDAFSRILAAETGRQADISEAEFVGVFEHVYATNGTRSQAMEPVMWFSRILLNGRMA
jgi:hypothetical protein